MRNHSWSHFSCSFSPNCNTSPHRILWTHSIHIESRPVEQVRNGGGGKGGHNAAGAEKNQHFRKNFLQFSTFASERPQPRVAKLASCPGRHLTLVRRCSWDHNKYWSSSFHTTSWTNSEADLPLVTYSFADVDKFLIPNVDSAPYSSSCALKIQWEGEAELLSNQSHLSTKHFWR